MAVDCTLQPGTSLSEAYEYVVSRYEADGTHVHRNDFFDRNAPTGGIARSFQLFLDPNAPVWILVYVGDWSDQDIVAFLNLGMIGSGDSVGGLEIVSANPVPEILQSLFSTSARAQFCLRAMCNVDASQLGTPVGPIMAEATAEKTAALIQESWGESLSIENTQLSELDDFILHKLRSVEDTSADQPGYVPEHALVGMGCLAGEIMLREARQNPQVKSAFWKIPDTPISRFGLAVEITFNDGGSAMINPIGKAFKVFENGDGDSLELLYRGSINLVMRSAEPKTENPNPSFLTRFKAYFTRGQKPK